MSYQEKEGLGEYYDPCDLSGEELTRYVNSLSSPELCQEERYCRVRLNKLRFMEAASLISSGLVFAVAYKMAEDNPVALLLGAGIAFGGYFLLSCHINKEAMVYEDFLDRTATRLNLYAGYPDLDISRRFVSGTDHEAVER